MNSNFLDNPSYFIKFNFLATLLTKVKLLVKLNSFAFSFYFSRLGIERVTAVIRIVIKLLSLN